MTYGGGRVGRRKNQLTRDSCSLSLPNTRVPCDNRKGAASAMLVPWGLREEGRGMEDTTSTQTLTPISRTTLFASPRMDRGVGSGSSASCHSPGPPSGAGDLIRAPSGLLHPGGCLQEGLMRNCLQMLSCKQDVKKGVGVVPQAVSRQGSWNGAWPVLPPPPVLLARPGRLGPGQVWAHCQGC